VGDHTDAQYAERDALLTNDLRVLVSELNEKLSVARDRGLDVLIEVSRAWVIGKPALQTSLQISVKTEVY